MLRRPDGSGMLTLGWGAQADARIVRRELDGELDGRMVAAYVAKYATKGTEAIGGIPVPIRCLADLDDWNVTAHVRRLIIACWQLGNRDEYADLKLARWAHQLGYRGHFSTRSRRYSVTLASRRTACAAGCRPSGASSRGQPCARRTHRSASGTRTSPTGRPG
jgi:Replication initiator protein, pSAM2